MIPHDMHNLVKGTLRAFRDKCIAEERAAIAKAEYGELIVEEERARQKPKRGRRRKGPAPRPDHVPESTKRDSAW